MRKFYTALFATLVFSYTGTAQCGFNNNTPTYFSTVVPQIQNGFPQLLGYPDVGTYMTVKVIKGLIYQVYTNRDNLPSQLRLDIYDTDNEQWLAGTAVNTGNPSSPAYPFNAYLSWQSTISGTVRINISDAGNCAVTDPHGLPASIAVTGSNTFEDPNGRGATDFTTNILSGTWVEHIYDEPLLPSETAAQFQHYIGDNILNSAALAANPGAFGFDQNFNSAGNPDSYAYPVQSGGEVRAGVLTSTFSARYKTAMTLCGTYRFRLYNDDGARVYINGSIVLEDWTDHSSGYTEWHTLTDYCGTFNIDIEYYDSYGDNVIRFEMEKISAISDNIAPVINNGSPVPQQDVMGAGNSFTVPDIRTLMRSLSTDNITPVNSLIITQATPIGTVINTRFTDVTAEVKDLSGNTASAVVRINNTNFTLPLHLLAFSGSRQQEHIAFQWRTEDEVNVSHIELLQSLDGRNFYTVHQVPAKGAVVNDYSLTIKAPLQEQPVHYKLKMVDIDGSFTHSQVIIVGGRSAANAFHYALAVSGNVYSILNKGNYNGRIKMEWVNAGGIRVYSGFVQLNRLEKKTMNSNLFPGVYFIVLSSPDGQYRQTIKMVRK